MCGIRSCGGIEKWEKIKLLTLIFCSFFDNRQKFVKEGDDVSKKSGGHRPLKAAKTSKVIVLAKSPIFDYK